MTKLWPLLLLMMLGGCGNSIEAERCLNDRKNNKSVENLWKAGKWKPKKKWLGWGRGCCAPRNNEYLVFYYKDETIRYYWNCEHDWYKTRDDKMIKKCIGNDWE